MLKYFGCDASFSFLEIGTNCLKICINLLAMIAEYSIYNTILRVQMNFWYFHKSTYLRGEIGGPNGRINEMHISSYF